MNKQLSARHDVSPSGVTVMRSVGADKSPSRCTTVAAVVLVVAILLAVIGTDARSPRLSSRSSADEWHRQPDGTARPDGRISELVTSQRISAFVVTAGFSTRCHREYQRISAHVTSPGIKELVTLPRECKQRSRLNLLRIGNTLPSPKPPRPPRPLPLSLPLHATRTTWCSLRVH